MFLTLLILILGTTESCQRQTLYLATSLSSWQVRRRCQNPPTATTGTNIIKLFTASESYVIWSKFEGTRWVIWCFASFTLLLCLITLYFLNGPNPSSFCLFSFFSNTNFTENNCTLRRIPNRIVEIEFDHADHLTTTTALPTWFLQQKNFCHYWGSNPGHQRPW